LIPEEITYPKPPLPDSPIPVVLKGQKALVTGANTGIGKRVAISLGLAGADVVVNYLRDEDAAIEVVEAIRKAGSRAIAIQADLLHEAEVQAMFRRAVEEFGTLDILVNNAGVHSMAPVDEMTLDQWNLVLGVNVTGQFLCIREAVRIFKQRGVVEKVSVSAGKIICISSVHENIPYPENANYAASKGAVMQLMKSVSQEVAPHRIRVNSICPGVTRTGLTTSVWENPEILNMLMRAVPYRRIGEPDDVARLAVFLASDQSDYINGTSVFIDGGMTLYSGLRELIRENLALRRELKASAQPQ
jgi:glucose 1-dehydrogenase